MLRDITAFTLRQGGPREGESTLSEGEVQLEGQSTYLDQETALAPGFSEHLLNIIQQTVY